MKNFCLIAILITGIVIDVYANEEDAIHGKIMSPVFRTLKNKAL